jgi:hypothetical protein
MQHSYSFNNVRPHVTADSLGRGREVVDSRTTNTTSVGRSNSTDIKQGQEAARGSGMLARTSKCDFASSRIHNLAV